jgi:hypothetical protein
MDEHPIDHPLVDSDESLVDDSDERRDKRRWPIVVVSVVVVIVALGAALYVAASHYQPLSQFPGGGYGSQILSSNGTLATNRITGPNGNIDWTEPSGVFHVEAVVTINNDQRFGVTIDKVLAPPNPSGTSDVHTYFDSKGSSIGSYGYKGGPAFTPTALGSKDQLELVVHWNQQCVPASASSAATKYTTLPVEFTFLGFRHTVTVPIDTITIIPRSTC